MKIRAGFVSNSSSSSFCILGIKMTGAIREKLEKLAEKAYKKKGKEIPEDWKEEESSELAYVCGFEFYDDENSEYGDIIGHDLNGLTPEQVVEVGKELKEAFGDEFTFKVMSGEYYC